MRVVTLLLVSLATLAGCIGEPSPPPQPAAEDGKGSIGGNGNGTPSETTPKETPKKVQPKPTLEVLREQVYVLQKDYNGREWICTGSLVSSTRVVTAAHCLDEGEFESWTVVAPLAPGKPRVAASNPQLMSYDYAAVENPDIGFLTLEEPIELPAYAVLTDVTGKVTGGAKVTAATVIRTEEEAEAPFEAVDGLEVSSTTKDGYDHGFGVALFSKGGDSGAGVFLFEDGQATHELIGVCRQPDPDTDTDHLTRIDEDVLAWFAEHPE